MSGLEIGSLAKAVSPLRSATAVQILTRLWWFHGPSRLGPHQYFGSTAALLLCRLHFVSWHLIEPGLLGQIGQEARPHFFRTNCCFEGQAPGPG